MTTIENNKSELYNKIIFLSALVLYFTNAWLSPGFNGGADSITHYQISRFSWDHPGLLMDQWGKPIFTILFSPIAQLGFFAVNLANLALIFWGGWLAYKIAIALQVKRPHWVTLIYFFTPILLGNSKSGLTEPICSIFLILFLYYATKEKWNLGAFILGFMPFARSEGFVMVLLAIIFFALSKRWRSIPYLLVGTLIFNTIGFFVTGKALWIFDNNPYINTGIKVYGSGSFFHFFILAVPMFGIPFLVVLYQSFKEIHWVKQIFSTDRWSLHQQISFWLLLGSFWGYFMAHTVLWSLGMWASLGLIRVMMVITVPFALLAVMGWEKLENNFAFYQKANTRKIFITLVIIAPFVMRLFSFQEIRVFPQMGSEEKVNRKLYDRLITTYEMEGKKTFSAHPYINLLLDIDPFDKQINDRLHRWKEAQPGDLVIWDGHFGPNEEQVFKEDIEKDSTFQLVMIVDPDKPFLTLNKYWYNIQVYEKK
jgi:hypothetical protein